MRIFSVNTMTGRGYLVFFLFLYVQLLVAQNRTQVLYRVDDIGMNHSVNMALKELADTKMPLSASVMFTCPWYQEAVEILKENPQISVGIHLTLNSEWKYFRWGPVLGKEAVPSLVDEVGYFLPSGIGFLESGFTLEEVEKELDAQIQRALASGVKLEYMDYHMRTAIATPELIQVIERLAAKYNLKQSMRMGENVVTLFDVPVEQKKDFLLGYLAKELDPEKPNVVVIHVAKANPEMNALVDMNNANQNTASVASHRQAELDLLLSEELKEAISKKNIELINYSNIQ